MRSLLSHIRRRWDLRDEAGIAMIITVSIMLLMTMIPLIVFNQAVQQLPLARHDQDHESALHAAEAGVDDYLNHLNNNNNYWLYTTYGASPDQNNALPGAPLGQEWAAVPGLPTNESFRYTVDTSSTSAQGVVTLTSSGRANGVVRTVKTQLRRLGFLDYLYLTDYEIVDPDLSGENATTCSVHAWQANPSTGGYGPPLSQCSVIYWTNSAVLNGPTHTNDGLYVCGNPQFLGNVDTAYNQPTSTTGGQFGGAGAYLNPKNCTNNPSFARTGDPVSGSVLDLPPVNTALTAQTDPTAGPGCLYTGPTTIALKWSGTTGYMDVTSPATKKTKAGCGPGTNLALPTNGVIYVQDVPQTTGDPNKSSCFGTACNGDVKLSNAATGGGYTGGLLGQLTIGAANDIIVTGNTTYHQYPGGTDVLGLIANNDVAVYHPVSNGNNAAGSVTDMRIDAAILSLQHSFFVQNWKTGSLLGNLTVNGVIAQKYRGPVGTFDGTGTTVSGYNKAYSYDTRLKYITPPYFLNPLKSSWVKNSFSEIKPAF
jgi:Tfp pilus assembly protein PilX